MSGQRQLTGVGAVWAVLALAALARADATITVDGLLGDWPADAWSFLDQTGDLPPPWCDITGVRATDDNSAGSDGNLYLALDLIRPFRPSIGSNDVDVYVSLDIDGDGFIGGPLDRVIELTEGQVTDGDGNPVGTIGAMAFFGLALEASIPYSVLGLEFGADSFGLAVAVTGKPDGQIEHAPEPGTGDSGFIVYDGTGGGEPLAVGLLGFEAQVSGRGVLLRWATASERANLGFVVLRRGDGGFWPLDGPMVPGLGDAALGQRYRLLDPQGRSGDVYALEDVEAGGRRMRRVLAVARPGPASPPVPDVRRDVPGPASKARENPSPKAVRGEVALFAARQAGAARFGWAELAAVGLDLAGLQRNGVVLDRGGQPVPVLLDAAGAWFVTRPLRDRYADFEVLGARPGRGAVMPRVTVETGCANAVDSLRAEVTVAEDHVYYVASPSGDPFFWASAATGAPAELVFDVPGVLAQPAELTVALLGVAAEHRSTLELNGQPLGERSWPNTVLSELDFALPAGLLLPAGNRLRIEPAAGQEPDLLFVEGLRLRYSRSLQLGPNGLDVVAPAGRCLRFDGLGEQALIALDATDPLAPLACLGSAGRPLRAEAGRLTLRVPGTAGEPRRILIADPEHRAATPTYLGPRARRDLASQSWAADSLIVTHPDFLPAAGRLAALHAQYGRNPLVVTTREAYDRFGDGRPTPAAIRALFRTARENWQQAPDHLVLLGGATVDSNGHLPGSPPNFVPAPFVRTARWRYEAPSDGWFVADAAGRPLAAVGRLAVGSPAEAEAVVDKIASVLAQAPPAGGRLVFVADDYDPLGGGSSDEFELSSEALIASCVPVGWEVLRVYKSQQADPAAALRSAMELDPDALVHFGHAYLSGWSSSPVWLDVAAAGSLVNRPFPLLSFACFDGGFTGPWAEALAWALVRNPSGGALAVAAAASLSDPQALSDLAEQVLCALTSGQAATVGQAMQLARDQLAGDGRPALQDLLRTFNLLGDPLLPNPWATR